MKWNKVEDSLPKMERISEGWTMSDIVFILLNAKYPLVGRVNHNVPYDKNPQWVFDGWGKVTHWAYVEYPNVEA